MPRAFAQNFALEAKSLMDLVRQRYPAANPLMDDPHCYSLFGCSALSMALSK